jgi:AcrR family transcriptional regulator
MRSSTPFSEPSPGPSDSPGLTRRERHRAETRARIVRAALALFARHGFAATRVDQITETADVGKGTFFNYFPTKEHVLAGFAGRQIRKIQAALDEARQGAAPLREVLFRLLLSLENEPGQNPALTRSLLVALLSSAAVRDLANPHLRQGRQLLAEIFRLGQERGEIRTGANPIELARFFQLSAFGTMFLWSLHPSPQLTAWQRPTFELVWSAFAPLAGTAPATRKLRAGAPGAKPRAPKDKEMRP